MKTGLDGLALIRGFEGCVLHAYLCPAKVLTIGFGSTGPHVKPGMVITGDEAIALLSKDLERFEQAVAKAVKAKLNQHQFDALVSFAFNVGIGAFQKSTLLKLLNVGDYASVPAQMARWNKGGGKVLPGLVRRRRAEGALFARPMT